MRHLTRFAVGPRAPLRRPPEESRRALVAGADPVPAGERLVGFAVVAFLILVMFA